MEAVLTTFIPSLVADKVFGDGEFVSLEEDSGASIGAQFSSAMVLANLTLRGQSGELRVVPLVIKIQCFADKNDIKDNNTMFYNEVKFYSEILPILDPKNEGNSAKMFYGFATGGENPEKDIIILENLKVDGFEMPRNKNVFLDFDHIAEAMRAIGKLHSMSYSLKYTEPKKFQDLIGKYKKRKEFTSFTEKLGYICMKRGINQFLKENIETDLLNKFLKVIESLNSVLEFIHAAHDPFGVILHGDYCKNNVLYKYDKSDKPIECAYFDFQFSKYGSPVVDLAFFLYMHTTAEVRDKHWDDFLQIYWKTVEENVRPEVQLPNCEEFQKYFASKAVTGYYVSSFFLPFLLFRDVDHTTLTEEMVIDYISKVGGDEATQMLSEIVSHLVKKKYLHSFLDLYNSRFSS